MKRAEVRIGTSGWSYPTGRGTWNGIFYPTAPGRRPARGTFDELAYYAEHFDTVEVNSTFYRVPTPSTTKSWVERTPKHFEFSAKLFQKFTHPALFAKKSGTDDARVGKADVNEFLRAIEPLRNAGKLGALLAQFPASFKSDPPSLDYLAWLLESFRDCSIAVELRHRSWSDDMPATLGLLNEHDAAWAQIDEPKFRFSVRQDLRPNVRGFFYMRLHGRNAAQWWKPGESEDRYNYLYSDKELDPFVEAAAAARRIVKKLYLYMNNHFEAKAVANAVMIKNSLGEPVSGAFPQSFVDRYPQVGDVVQVAPSRTADSLFDDR